MEGPRGEVLGKFAFWTTGKPLSLEDASIMSESRSQGSSALEEGWRVPLPPLLEIQRGELKSVAPWDEGPGPSSEPWERWLLKAMRGPLSPRKKRRLAEKLAAGRVSADRWTLELVEGLLVHNQEVLVEALANDDGREDAPRLVLVRLDVSLAHLEVMQKLISRGAMSEEYVLLHILNCVERCREGEDGSAKNRRARLFCLFLQQMIAGGFVNGQVKEAMVELQSFCIEFSRVPEAAQLFKLIKSVG